MSKKLIKIMIIGVSALVFLFVILWVISLFRDSNLSFEKIENKIVSATEQYYKNNPELLPTEDYSKKELNIDSLVKEGYIKSLNKYVPAGVNCSGKVVVLKNENNYTYIPKLNCGDDYNTKTLVGKLTNNIVTKGEGLYKINDEYVYRGENLNNYVSFAGKIWRIIRVTKNNEIRLIQEDKFDKVVWDNRYNSDRRSTVGINQFEINGVNSRIKEELEEIYNEKTFDSEDKAKLVPQQLCIGKRNYGDTTTEGSVECSVLTEEKHSIGLLQANEYMVSSLDPGCTATNKRACTNYNFLANYPDRFWTLTANAENTHQVYYIDRLITEASANGKFSIKLVINISGEVNYTKGDGTQENPYVID